MAAAKPLASIETNSGELDLLPTPLLALCSLGSVTSNLRLILVPGRSRNHLKKSKVLLEKYQLVHSQTCFHVKGKTMCALWDILEIKWAS